MTTLGVVIQGAARGLNKTRAQFVVFQIMWVQPQRPGRQPFVSGAEIGKIAGPVVPSPRQPGFEGERRGRRGPGFLSREDTQLQAKLRR